MKSLVKKLTAVCLCVGMLAVSAPRTLAASSEEDAIADLNERYEQLEKEAEALQEKIDNAQTEKAKQEAIKENKDIASTSEVFERMESRVKIAGTDIGSELQHQVDDLKALLHAYRMGEILEDHRG